MNVYIENLILPSEIALSVLKARFENYGAMIKKHTALGEVITEETFKKIPKFYLSMARNLSQGLKMGIFRYLGYTEVFKEKGVKVAEAMVTTRQGDRTLENQYELYEANAAEVFDLDKGDVSVEVVHAIKVQCAYSNNLYYILQIDHEDEPKPWLKKGSYDVVAALAATVPTICDHSLITHLVRQGEWFGQGLSEMPDLDNLLISSLTGDMYKNLMSYQDIEKLNIEFPIQKVVYLSNDGSSTNRHRIVGDVTLIKEVQFQPATWNDFKMRAVVVKTGQDPAVVVDETHGDVPLQTETIYIFLTGKEDFIGADGVDITENLD